MQEFLSSPSASSLSLRPSSTLVHVRHTLVCINKRISSLSEIRRKGEWLVFRGIRRNYVREWCADSRKLTKKSGSWSGASYCRFRVRDSPNNPWGNSISIDWTVDLFMPASNISFSLYGYPVSFPFEMRDDSFVYI